MSAVSDLHNTPDTAQKAEMVSQPTPVSRDELSGTTREELAVRRRRRLAKWSQVITLIFAILEMAIAFRVLLKLIAANPASPFAQFMYQMTGPFLAPFAGLTATPSADGAVLEIPALIAMLVYGVLYLLVIRVLWLIFEPAKARDAAKYEPDL
jgi:uncharacterized protein YggT (Ycf19 family)